MSKQYQKQKEKWIKQGRKLAEKDFKELIDKLGHDDLIEKEELKKELGKI